MAEDAAQTCFVAWIADEVPGRHGVTKTVREHTFHTRSTGERRERFVETTFGEWPAVVAQEEMPCRLVTTWATCPALHKFVALIKVMSQRSDGPATIASLTGAEVQRVFASTFQAHDDTPLFEIDIRPTDRADATDTHPGVEHQQHDRGVTCTCRRFASSADQPPHIVLRQWRPSAAWRFRASHARERVV